MSSPLPCYLLTGILGAGKTTLLNRLLKGLGDRRFGIVVNEFGTIDVDGELVEGSSGPQLSLANGCICCTIRDDLERSVAELLENNPQLEGLLVEASGVADPQPIANTFLLSDRLRPLVRLDSVIAVVDLEAFPLLRGQHAFLARRQVAASDLVLLNKRDLVTDEQAKSVQSSLTNWVSQIRAVECAEAHVPLELLLGDSRFTVEQLPEGEPVEVHVHGPGEGCHHHSHQQFVLDKWSYTEPGPFQARALASILKNLPLGVYRAKGLVTLHGEGEQFFSVQLCGTRLDIRPIGKNGTDGGLVFLAEHGTLDIDDLKSKLEKASEAPTELSPSEALAEKVKRILGEDV